MTTLTIPKNHRFTHRTPLFIGCVSTLMCLATIVLLHVRMAYASFPILGVGGIVVTAPVIEGSTDVTFAASSSVTDEQQNYPTAQLAGDNVEFPDGLVLTKTVDVSATPLAADGIYKVIFKFTVNSATSIDPTSWQISGIQSDQVSFTTGYDASGNPVMNDASGQHPLQDASNFKEQELTNASLNVHSMNFDQMNWNISSVQVIAADQNGNPVN